MMDKTNEKLSKASYIPVIITENNAEHALRSYKAILVPASYDHPFSGVKTNKIAVPAFLSVYSGYLVSFGSVFTQADFQ